MVIFPVLARLLSQKMHCSCSPINQHSISWRTPFFVPFRHPSLLLLQYPASSVMDLVEEGQVKWLLFIGWSVKVKGKRVELTMSWQFFL